MSETANEIQDLKKQIAQLHWAFLFIISIALLVLMFVNLQLVFLCPFLEALFREVFTPWERLPDLTKSVFSYQGGLGRYLPLAFVTVIPLLTIILLFVFRRSSKVFILAGGVALLLTAHWVIVTLAIQMPMLMFFHQINAR